MGGERRLSPPTRPGYEANISHKSGVYVSSLVNMNKIFLSTALDSNPFDTGLPGHHGPSNPVSVPGLVIFVLIGLLAVVAIAVVVYKCKRQESPREYLVSECIA